MRGRVTLISLADEVADELIEMITEVPRTLFGNVAEADQEC